MNKATHSDTVAQEEDDNNAVTVDQIIALVQRSIAALSIDKAQLVRNDTDEDAARWARRNAKQAELNDLLGRITAHKFGIRSIEASGD